MRRETIYIDNKKLAILVLGLVELRMLKLGIVVGSNCGILREMRRKDEKKKDLSGRLQFTKKKEGEECGTGTF